ncbi:hypothetical protein HMPREF3216_01102 [Gardnerella vaginalis]|uniref:Uncharacterized protein n=1 Tax=Gardnerella vaginalis TaxID=2702 RepID=A0A133NMN2_GARVA|nr:hypothetical protein HMPREF3216_01102 [Gardnerella vaginalis]
MRRACLKLKVQWTFNASAACCVSIDAAGATPSMIFRTLYQIQPKTRTKSGTN